MQKSLLSMRDVRVRFGGVVALDITQFDLAAVDGIAAVFIGPNGAGKTTLLNAITGYVPVRRPGRVVLATTRLQRDIGGIGPAAAVKAGIARTFQNPCLFQSLSVGQVLALAAHFAGVSNCTLRDNAAWLDIISMVASKCRLKTDLPTADLTLAAGRRLDLARALMCRPRLLLLDEPTAGLSELDKAELLTFLATDVRAIVSELSGEPGGTVTIGIVTHDMNFLSALDSARLLSGATVTFMNLGQIAAQGDLESVTRADIVREAYLGR